MRTLPFTSVMTGVLARMGLDPTSPSASTVAVFAEYISSSVRGCWESYPWPELITVEQRQFYPTWVTGTTYAAASVVLGSDGNYYYAVQASTSQNPTTDSTDTYWQLASSVTLPNGKGINYVVPLDQVINGTTQTPMGDVLEVYSADPRANRYAPRISWELNNSGVVVFAPAMPAYVWIKFKQRPTSYSSLSMTNGDTIPYILAEAVKYASCACAQMEDGQYDKSQMLNQMSSAILALEFDKISNKNQEPGKFMAMSQTKPVPAGIQAAEKYSNP